MCGRLSQSRPASEYARYAGIEHDVEERPGRYNLAPSQPLAVITHRQGRKDIEWCVWGFVPHWVRDPATLKTRPINARIETVGEKPMFRDAWRRGQRGIIPVDGFYEWRTERGKKQPYFIRRRDGAPMLLGALWDVWGSDNYITCTVLVGEPNELVQPLHDRMPVIISVQEVDAWLEQRFIAGTSENPVVPFPAEALEAYAVDPRVNKPEFDEPQCIIPLDQMTH